MQEVIMNPDVFPVVGFVGENEYRRLIFDISAYQTEYPEADYLITFQRPGDPAAYPVPDSQIEIVDDTLCWTMSDADLARSGTGMCQLVLTYEDTVAKTEIYAVDVRAALDNSTEPPEPWQSWVNEVTGAAEAASRSATDAHAEAVAAGEQADRAEGYANQAEGVVQRYGMHGAAISGEDYRLYVGAGQ